MSDDWDIDEDEINAKAVKTDNSKFDDEFEGDFDDLQPTKVEEKQPEKEEPKKEEPKPQPATTSQKPWGNKAATPAPQPYAAQPKAPQAQPNSQPKPWGNKPASVAQPAPQPFGQPKVEAKPVAPKPWDKPKETTPEPAAQPAKPAQPKAQPAPQPFAQPKAPQAQPKQPPPKKPQPQSASKAAVDQKKQGAQKPAQTGPAKPGPKFEFQPKAAKDFTEFQKKVVDTIQPFSAEDEYVAFCVEVSKALASSEDISADDVRQMVTALTLIMNQKIKSAKTSTKKPIKKKGGVVLNRGAASAFDDLTDAKYDNGFEDDFM